MNRFKAGQEWWQARLPRERMLLLVCGLICTVGVFYVSAGALGALRESAQAERDKEQRALWRMQRRGDELLRLKAQPPLARPDGAQLHAATASLLGRHGLPPDLLQVLPGGDLKLSGQVGFEQWLSWLAAAQTELGLIVRQVRIETGEVAGTVALSAEMALREENR